MENTQIRDRISKQLNYTFDTRKLFASFLVNWYWFLIAIAAFVTIGVLYLRYTTPVYSIKSSLLIENKESDISSSLLNKVEGLRSGRDEKGNLFNEILVLRSKDLIQEVVDSIDLNVHYWVKGRVKETELYEESPIRLEIQFSKYPEQDIVLTVKQVVDGQFEVKEGGRSLRVFYDSWIQTNYGKYKIVYSKGDYVNTGYLQNDIKVIIEDPSKTTDNILNVYNVNSSDGRTSMLEMSYVDNLPRRGIDFMNALIKQYHRNELYNITQFAIKTRDFINQRQKDLIDNLKAVDAKVVNIQTSSEVVDLASSAENYVKGKAESEKSIQELLIRKKAIENLKNSVLTNVGKNTVIAGIGSEDVLLTGLVTQYNNAITKLEPLLSEPALNPQRKQMESEIAAIRKRIADASDKVLASINIALQSASSKESEYSSLMRNVPAIGRSINDVKREYDVLQNMYLLLYQKGIENEITLNAANNKSKVVVAPYYAAAPLSPVRKNVFIIAFLMGLLVPGTALLIKEIFDNKINNEKDITSLTDLPLIGTVSKGKLKEDIVVGEHIRTGIAEQFRLIRANLDFMGTGDRKKIIMITSSISGEGKTFVSINLGLTMALANKRILVMEFDLRKPKISERLNLSREGGISGYVAGIAGLDKVVKPSGLHPNLFIANCGPMPPNPSELLLLPKTQQLIEELNEMFDTIIIDTAPIGMVSDALILSKYSGINLFVTRQAYTLKDQVRMLEGIKESGKINNIAILFNGVEHRSKYGYGYGYSYGYGEGQGYYENDTAGQKKKGSGKSKKKS